MEYDGAFLPTFGILGGSKTHESIAIICSPGSKTRLGALNTGPPDRSEMAPPGTPPGAPFFGVPPGPPRRPVNQGIGVKMGGENL